MDLPSFVEDLFVLPNDRELLFKKHNKLCLFEQLIEKLDTFLVLKKETYDDMFETVFIVHCNILQLRDVFVKKLYSDKDKVWWRKTNQEMLEFLDESLQCWPELRKRQRHHLCFYLGENILDDALHPDKKNNWPLLHFKLANYMSTEPQIVRNHQEEPNFRLTKDKEEIVYRLLNSFVTELDTLIQQIMEDPFYEAECFDEFFATCQSLRIDLTIVRQHCVDKYVRGQEAKYLIEFFDERVCHLRDYSLLKETRNDQR